MFNIVYYYYNNNLTLYNIVVEIRYLLFEDGVVYIVYTLHTYYTFIIIHIYTEYSRGPLSSAICTDDPIAGIECGGKCDAVGDHWKGWQCASSPPPPRESPAEKKGQCHPAAAEGVDGKLGGVRDARVRIRFRPIGTAGRIAVGWYSPPPCMPVPRAAPPIAQPRERAGTTVKFNYRIIILVRARAFVRTRALDILFTGRIDISYDDESTFHVQCAVCVMYTCRIVAASARDHIIP